MQNKIRSDDKWIHLLRTRLRHMQEEVPGLVGDAMVGR